MGLLLSTLFMLTQLYMYIYLCYLIALYLHGYLPRDFMKTAIVLINKNKTGDSRDKSNYTPIALVTVCSKYLKFVSWK